MHLVLAVEDVERAYDFYRRAFGWEQHLQWPGEYVELALPDGDWLGLYRREGYAETAGAQPAELNGQVSPSYLYVRVDDVRDAEKRLREAGAKALSPRSERGWGDEAVYFADPDGNVVAVGRRLDG